MMNEQDSFSEMLSAFLDHELQPEEASTLFYALAHDQELQTELRQLVAMRQAFQPSLLAPPPRLEENILTATGLAADTGAAGAGKSFFGSRGFSMVVSAVAASLLTMGVFLLGDTTEEAGREQPHRSATPPTTVTEIPGHDAPGEYRKNNAVDVPRRSAGERSSESAGQASLSAGRSSQEAVATEFDRKDKVRLQPGDAKPYSPVHDGTARMEGDGSMRQSVPPSGRQTSVTALGKSMQDSDKPTVSTEKVSVRHNDGLDETEEPVAVSPVLLRSAEASAESEQTAWDKGENSGQPTALSVLPTEQKTEVPEFAASSGEPRRFSLNIRGFTAKSFPNVELPPLTDPPLNNFSVGISYSLSKHHKIGLEAGQENFLQKYEEHSADPLAQGSIRYEQNYLGLWVGGSYEYSMDEIGFLGNVRPFVRGILGANRTGPMGRATLGLQYDVGALTFLAGGEGTVLYYQHEGVWFSTRKLGATYGIAVHF